MAPIQRPETVERFLSRLAIVPLHQYSGYRPILSGLARPEVLEKLEEPVFVDLCVVHVRVWARVLLNQDRLELGVYYFGFAGTVAFEETILVFQWRYTCSFLMYD